ncbi:GNAT family N-acetyltransferase [Candidatus Latescibacterota bacterium]
MHSSQIVRLDDNRQRLAADVLTRAFMDDPMHCVVIPDEDERRRSFNLLWNALIIYSLRYGDVHTTEGTEGVACWLTPGNTSVSLWRVIRTSFEIPRAVMRFKPDSRKRLMTLLNFIEKKHEKLIRCPHWYLWALGVDPDHLGKGIGGKLLDTAIDLAERENIPLYLETETEGNVSFYMKHGFQVIDESSHLDSSVRLWYMLRG